MFQGPVFKTIKRLFRSRRYEPRPTDRANINLAQGLEEAPDISPDHKNKITDFVGRLNFRLLSHACRAANVEKGFKQAGVWPFDMQQILRNVKGFQKLDFGLGQTVKEAMIKTIRAARQHAHSAGLFCAGQKDS